MTNQSSYSELADLALDDSPPQSPSESLHWYSHLTNGAESKSFIRTALRWRGSASPSVLPRVLWTSLYTGLMFAVFQSFPEMHMDITPFEYSGAVLAMILVVRLNSGHDRWWEARKLWGQFVNQSRNLAICLKAYTAPSDLQLQTFRWIALWPHVLRQQLRGEKVFPEALRLVGQNAQKELQAAPHPSIYVATQIASHLRELKSEGMDPYAFMRAETERSGIIDAIGGCERIRSTRMPLVLAIKTRRFILLFLALLPVALFERCGYYTPLVVALAAYPLFSLDEIGAELQNPFSPRNLSHLPLDQITQDLEKHILSTQRL